MTGLYANTQAGSAEGKELAERVMSSVGQCVWVENESDLDVVTAISGSGPAYFFLFIESLTDAAIALGMNSESARKLALQTALGPRGSQVSAARMRLHCARMSQVQGVRQSKPFRSLRQPTFEASWRGQHKQPPIARWN